VNIEFPKAASDAVSFIKERLALADEGGRQAQKLVWSIASAENAKLTVLCVICVLCG